MTRAGRGREVHTITGARRGISDDVSSRSRRYLISMGVRTVCFVLAVVCTGWLRWVFAAGALLLPWFSVVFANSGRERLDSNAVIAPYQPRPALGPGGPTAAEPPAAGPDGLPLDTPPADSHST